MNRKLKVLGLAFLAVFAMSALTASAAQAQLKVTTTGLTWLTFDSIGEQTFTTPSGLKVTCSVVDGHATVENNQTSVTATGIKYTNCDTSLGGPATVTMNNCDYKFHGGKTDPNNPEHGIEGEVDLVCPGGGPVIDIYASIAKHEAGETLCKLTVTPFTNKKEITYTNTPETSGGIPNDFDLKSEVVTNFTKEGSLLCPASGTATYKGEITVTGFVDKGTNPDGSPNEGARTGVTIS